MTYRQHISKARASATVNAPEIIAAMVRADYEPTSGRRVERLNEALRYAFDLVSDIKTAIAVEMEAVTPAEAVERCRAAIGDAS